MTDSESDGGLPQRVSVNPAGISAIRLQARAGETEPVEDDTEGEQTDCLCGVAGVDIAFEPEHDWLQVNRSKPLTNLDFEVVSEVRLQWWTFLLIVGVMLLPPLYPVAWKYDPSRRGCGDWHAMC